MFSSLILQPRPLCVCKYFQDIWRSSRPPCLAHVTEPPLLPLFLAHSPPPSHPPLPPACSSPSSCQCLARGFAAPPRIPVSVTRGDLEMITPDEPWMRGNLTTTALGAARAGQGRRRCSTAGARDRRLAACTQIGLQSQCVSRTQRGCAWRRTAKWISAPLYYWWDTLWCQPRRKEHSKMTVSAEAHDHLCKQYRGVINCHSLLSSPAHTPSLPFTCCQMKSIYLSVLFCKGEFL